MGGHAPGAVLHGVVIGLVGVEPHVPLVKAEHDILLGALLGLDEVAGGDDGADEVVHVVRLGQKIPGVVEAVAIVGVQGDEVHAVIGLLQHSGLPLGIGGHARVGAAAGHQLQAGVNLLHGFGGLVSQAAILPGRLVAGLPGAVHLIAQAPHLDVVGVLHPVGDAQVAVLGAGGMVAILQQVAGGVNSPGAQVHGHHQLCAGLFAPGGELVDTHQVGLGAAPGQFQPPGSVRHRAHAVLPIEVGDKVAAGIADDGHADFLHQVQHVLAEALLVSRRMPGLVHAAVNGPAQMLHKGAVDALVHPADGKVFVQGDAGKFLIHRKTAFLSKTELSVQIRPL